MANAQDTGTGATFVLGTTAYAVRIKDVSVTAESVEMLETTHLGSSGTKTYTPGDLKETVEIDLNIFFDPNEAPATGVAQTGTLTYKVPTGSSNGATQAGTCVVTGSSHTVAPGVLMEGSFKVKYTGAVTRTDAS